MEQHPLNRPDVLAEQYRQPGNLQARMSLHERYRTNKYPFHAWVFDHFDLPPNARVLELGCGVGKLWSENAARIPPGWDITLSDFSEGMLNQSRASLSESGRAFRFERFDAEVIPFESHSLDAVIANHMLYHVQNLDRALADIARVLKPGGRLYAATNGEGHMREMDGLLDGFVENILRITLTQGFNLENGEASLRRHFADVTVDTFDNELRVTEVQPLADYLLSMRAQIPDERRGEFMARLEAAFAANGGVFVIRTHSGLFTAKAA